MTTRSTPSDKPRIAVTMGDPCGVGPEIIVKAFLEDAEEGELARECEPVVIGEPLALRRALAVLGKEPDDLERFFVMSPLPLREEDIAYGKPSEAACRATVQWIEAAARMAVGRKVDAIVTCPIHKANLHRRGFSFPGHTEFLQHITGSDNVFMMLAGPRLRVVLVTIHEALADVPKLLNVDNITRTIRISGETLVRDFGMKSPRIAVAGLNPHAGEGGMFGREEVELIRPVVESFAGSTHQGVPYEVSGPHSPDTVFHRAHGGEFDAVVCMYHDQGLIPVKLAHFDEAVNVSLGLPIIRTSVDHGTAYDIAGTGTASDGSLRQAVRLATTMARNRFQPGQPAEP